MRQFASRYPRLSVQDSGFLDLEHAGLPQHVAILAVAEGGPLQDPDGRLRVDAVRQQLAGRLELVPRLRQRGLCCIWLTGGMLTLPLPPEHQIAKANSLNATATRRVTGSSTASS